MRTDWYFRAAATAIAVFLGMLALRPYLAPAAARAQAPEPPGQLYIEPGVHTIRLPEGAGEVSGKIVMDLRTGSVWGFPTGLRLPYPVTLHSEAPVSHPIYLGKFDLAAIEKRP
ncbi:MAG TPA: hypothetical protein VF767_03055 [Bryobacteraceae bacterium]